MVTRYKTRVVFLLGIAMISVYILLAAATAGLAEYASQCDEYARDYADRNSYAASGGGALGGAARGAAGGALFGAITGDAGKGAAIGAGVGAITGGARRAHSWQYYYDRAFSECMRGR